MNGRWPIDRMWSVISADSSTDELHTRELSRFPVVCLLGAAGLGKTTEMDLLYETDRQSHGHVARRSIADIATDAAAMREDLDALLRPETDDTVVLLDSLDEAMVPVPQAGTVISNWIGKKHPGEFKLRLACRSTVWPRFLLAKLQEVFGPDFVRVAELLPLEEGDVHIAAVADGLDPDAFMDEVRSSGSGTLAARPLTLQLLMDEFRATGTVGTGGRAELFARAVRRLCEESEERRDRRTATIRNVSRYIEFAEGIAVLTLLSGRESVTQREQVDATSAPIPLALIENLVEGLEDPVRLFDTGLFTTDAAKQYRFVHRQFAEFLAGRRIATLDTSQVRAMLALDGDPESGVAGPLHEIAAWAASLNPGIAAWIAGADPEIVGRSEVADDQLRRKAFLSVAEMYRLGRLTQSQLHHDDALVSGFDYDGIEAELRGLLSDPAERLADLHAFAITVAEKNRLSGVAYALAAIATDPRWSLGTRTLAARAVVSIGEPESILSLKPLTAGLPEDSDDDLKGIALRVLWPDSIADSELLPLLSTPRRSNYLGPYKYFLWLLAQGRIPVPRVSSESLRWAAEACEPRHSLSPINSIAGGVAYRALDEWQKPEMRNGLVAYILRCADVGSDPFYVYRQETDSFRSNDKTAIGGRFAADSDLRRSMIVELCRAAPSDSDSLMAVRSIPALFDISDFEWLLEQAASASGAISERVSRMAAWLPWPQHANCFEQLQRYLSVPAVASVFPKMSVRLGSEEARQQKEYYELQNRATIPVRSSGDWSNVLSISLAKSEESPRWFAGICRALTMGDGGISHYTRFLSGTEAWEQTDETTRQRIVGVARRFVAECSDLSNQLRTVELSAIPMGGVMEAFFLLIDCDSSFLSALDDRRWKAWAWYIIRELRFRLDSEPMTQKKRLIELLVEREEGSVVRGVSRLARMPDGESTLNSLLEALEGTDSAALDSRLCSLVGDRHVRKANVPLIMQYALMRSPAAGIRECVGQLRCRVGGAIPGRTVAAAISLLREAPEESGDVVLEMLWRCPSVSRRVLSLLADSSGMEFQWLSKMTTQQKGNLLQLLFVAFPPKNDPEDEGARFLGPAESAIFLRRQLMAHLSGIATPEAVAALRHLEERHGSEYPWLRFPRSDAEYHQRRLRWQPLQVEDLVWMLTSSAARLLRSEADLMNIVVELLREFQDALSGTPPLAQNLWNTPRDGCPSPKEEEAVSDNLLSFIRGKLADHGAVAMREAQLKRRLVAKQFGGARGQKTDIYVEAVPNESHPQTLRLVVEVKNSYNPETRTGLRDQLVERYLIQNGWWYGLYVVAYLDALENQHKPLWQNPDEALRELTGQADILMKEIDGLHVGVVVLDASI